MKVLVIPENPTLDQHILKPVVERIFRELRRTVRIEVLSDPHLNGVDEALNPDILASIIHENPMIDLFLLIVDRDCAGGREQAVSDREARHAGRLIGCVAIEEVEVWALALHRRLISGKWKEIRVECHPKEVYFDRLVERQKWQAALGRGRAVAMEALPRQWRALKNRCTEIQTLLERIREWLSRSA